MQELLEPHRFGEETRVEGLAGRRPHDRSGDRGAQRLDGRVDLEPRRDVVGASRAIVRDPSGGFENTLEVEAQTALREKVEAVGGHRDRQRTSLVSFHFRLGREEQIVERGVVERPTRDREQPASVEDRPRHGYGPPAVSAARSSWKSSRMSLQPSATIARRVIPIPQAITGHFDAQGAEHFRPEQTAREDLDPPESGVADVPLDGRFGERKVARPDLHLADPDRVGEGGEDPDEVPEVEPLLSDDALALSELEVVARVDLLSPEIPVDREHAERGAGVSGEIAGGDRGGLGPQHRTDRDPGVVRSRPSGAEGGGHPRQRTTFVDRRDASKKVRRRWLSFDPFDRKCVVDRAGGMVLRHEQDVVVPELRLEDRALGLLEPEPDEDLFEFLEPGDIRVWSRPRGVGHGRPSIVRPERPVLPASRTQHLGGDRAQQVLAFGGER